MLEMASPSYRTKGPNQIGLRLKSTKSQSILSSIWPSMNLPPKALHALLDIKKELLSKSVMITSTQVRVPVLIVPSKADVMITRKPSHVMRHARVCGRAVQQMYQRGEL